MPAISGPFGPIVEPGWPATLPRLGNIGQDFVNAWATGQAIRNQRSKLEEQMQLMALRERQMEINEGRQAEMFELKKQAQDQKARYDEAIIGIRQENADRAVQSVVDREQKLRDSTDDTQGFTQYVLESGVPETDPNYPATLRKALLLNKHANVNLDKIFRQRNSTLDNMEKHLDSEKNAYLGQIGVDHFGNKSFSDASVFLNPRYQKEAVETEPTQEDIDAGRKTGTPMPPYMEHDKAMEGRKYKLDPKTGGYVKAGGKMIEYPDPVKQGQSKFEFFPDEELGKIHSKLDNFEKRRLKIAPKEDVGTDMSIPPIQIFNERELSRVPKGQGLRIFYIDPKTGERKDYTVN